MILDLEDGTGERPYIKWNISSIPTTAKILDVRLYLYAYPNNLDPDDYVEVWYVDNQTWTEEDVNNPDFLNKPALTSKTLNLSGLNAIDTFIEIGDLSADIQKEINNGHTKVSWALVSKANSDTDYANFYSKEYLDDSKLPYLIIKYSIVDIFPTPKITSFSPSNLTPSITQNTTASFNVTTDQQVSSTWYLNGANQNNNAQAWSHTWNMTGQYNVTYVGSNGNGSVSIMWNVMVAINFIDLTPPKFSKNSTSPIMSGQAVEHRLFWTDETNLSGYIFSFDNGKGIFVNDTWTRWFGTPQTAWSNVTKIINSSDSSQIRWKVYANDTSNNWEASSIYSYNYVNYSIVRLQAANIENLEDTFADQDNPGANGADDLMILDLEDGTGERPYIKWNISSIPTTAKILDVRLYLYAYPNNLDPDDYVEVWYVDNQTWTEEDVNNPDFLNKPALTSKTLNLSGLNAIDTFIEIGDLSADIQKEINNGHTKVSWALVSKANSDTDYANFYSKEYLDDSKLPYLIIKYSIVDIFPTPKITSFSPSNLTPSITQNTTASFNVTTDQQVSSTWYLNGANQNNNTQAWSRTWGTVGQHNVTYVGLNSNGSVSIMWNVSVVTFSPYDVNRDGYVNEADLAVIRAHFGQITYAPYPPYDVVRYGIVDVYDIAVVSNNILE